MIFPDWGSAPTQQTGSTALPLYTEWAVDWDSGSFALANGLPFLVSGTEALKIWVACALHPDSSRFSCSAHSPDYGNEFSALVGECMDRGILESQLRRSIREALLISPYITAADGFSFSQKGSLVTVHFTVRTVYEDFTAKTEVILE